MSDSADWCDATRPGDGNFDAVVFDLDGVIVDTERVVLQVWADEFVRYGCSFTTDEWSAVVGSGHGFDPVAAIRERCTVPVPSPAALRQETDLRLELLLTGLKPLPGVREWLDEAESLNIVVGVASSSPRDWVESRLTQAGLDGRFRIVSCRDEGLRAKPAPDIYLDACRRLNVEPNRALAIEDSTNGVVAAKEAGLWCLAVPNVVTEGYDLSGADLIVESLVAVSIDEVKRRVSKDRMQP
jgi:HAD superfamily hydrolase (TIGR01509 family)